MQSATPDNANPIIHSASNNKRNNNNKILDFSGDEFWSNSLNQFEEGNEDINELVGSGEEEIDQDEIFDLIRSITDPEHPLTLEQLAVVSANQITITHGSRPHVLVEFTPTIPHCSMATLIGLSLRVRLLRSLPERFKVDIKVKEGTHQSENAVNKQLNDKERVAAALENNHLLEVVSQCLASAGQRGGTLLA